MIDIHLKLGANELGSFSIFELTVVLPLLQLLFGSKSSPSSWIKAAFEIKKQSISIFISISLSILQI